MSEIQTSKYAVEHRNSLSNKSPLMMNGVSLRPLREGHVLHLLSAARDGDCVYSVRAALGHLALSLRAVSPGQWFVAGDEPFSAAALAAVAESLKPYATVVDQSHGRVRIEIAGTHATRVLAKGSAVDLASHVFPIGQATSALIGHIAVHITRSSEYGFELLVLRSFAESLWDELAQMSAEFR
ncbi:sarcosine oxidase subunit gamma family protein [Mesorhizobium caraganae]|uniref:sarcosine oxidase subunit gamma family protein n=1 Tax=Mesorhizobium caraganae TaxID=483206 RepID=UPI003ED148DB